MVTLCITVRSQSAGPGDRPIREWEECFPSLEAAQQREAALSTPPTDAEAYRDWCEQIVSCHTRVEAHEVVPHAVLRTHNPEAPPEMPIVRPRFPGFE